MRAQKGYRAVTSGVKTFSASCYRVFAHWTECVRDITNERTRLRRNITADFHLLKSKIAHIIKWLSWLPDHMRPETFAK